MINKKIAQAEKDLYETELDYSTYLLRKFYQIK